jgi:TolA-binding protein
MKKRTQKVFLVFSIFSAFTTLLSLAHASVPLSSYEARFEVIADVDNRFRDVLVELKLAYGDHDVSRIKDMKLIEAPVVEDVAVTDGAGNQLGFTVKTGEKESTIIWNLTSAQAGKQVVIIRFRLPGAITTKEGRNIFGAYWVGGFIVPVERALYRFIFPAGYAFKECSVYPQYGYEEKIVDEKREVNVAIAPLKGESFALACKPDFGEWKRSLEEAKTMALKSDPAKNNVEKEEVFPTGASEDREEVVSEKDAPQGFSEENKPVEETVLSVTVTDPRENREMREEGVKEEEGEEGKEERIEDVEIPEEKILAPAMTETNEDGESRREEEFLDADAQRVYASARELFLQGKYQKALSTLRYFTDTYPQSKRVDAASYLIGECYFHLAEQSVLSSYQPAVDALQLALALYPDSPEAPRGLFQMANGLRKMGYHFEAQENYQLLIDKFPNRESNAEAYFWIAEDLFQQDEFKEAKNRFQHFIAKYPRNDYVKHATFRVADCYVGMKDYGRAQGAYEKARDRWPLYSGLFPETLYRMGLTYLKKGDYSKARSILFAALNVFPEEEYNHIIVTRIGDTYREEGKVEQALKVYSQNGVLYPETRGAMISEIKMADLGISNPGFFNFIQCLEPLKVYEKVIEKYPATDLAEEALYKEGWALAEQKKYQEAINSLMTVLMDYPDSELSEKCFYSVQKNLIKLIDSYFSEENYYRLLEIYQKYKDPFLVEVKNTKTLFQLGESFRQAGLYDDALELFGEAKRIYPPNHPEDELTFRVGEIYLLQKSHVQAEKLFKKVITTFPESAFYRRAFHKLADTYFEQERYGEARLAYFSALQSEEKGVRDIKSLFRLGKCYQALGEESLTVDTYKKAIRVAENLGAEQGADEFVIESYFTLADFLYQIKWYGDAIEAYTQAIERFPEDDRAQWALYRIAASYRKGKNEDVDIESLKQLTTTGGGEAFWKKVANEHIRNLEWEVKSRDYEKP